MQVKDGTGKIIHPGVPGRKWVRRLDPERVKLAVRNSKIKGFNEKFRQPKIKRRCPSISPSLFGQKLQAWRWSKNLYAKEAAQKLATPFDTYRGWESGKHTPQLIVQREIESRMRKVDLEESKKKSGHT